MLSYPSGMTVSTRALSTLADVLRRRRREQATRWRKLTAGRQALLVVAHLRKGETYSDLACGFGIGTSTVYRYLREAIGLLAAMAPTVDQAIAVARGKAFVILDGTLLRIDRVGMTAGYDRAFYSGKHKCHGVNVQVIADPAGRLVWISPVLPGARHDMGAAREHGIIDALPRPGSTPSPTPPTRAADPRSESRSGAAASTPTPAATAACPATRRRSTPRTPANAAPASGSTPNSRTGASCARSVPAPAGPANSSPQFRPS